MLMPHPTLDKAFTQAEVHNTDEPSLYRHISLLDSTGKILERMILNRIKSQVAVGLTTNQYGFRPGSGTMEAIEAVLGVAAKAARGFTRDRHLCVLVTLDVRNALICHHGRGLTQRLRALDSY